MVIHDLNVFGASVRPMETYAELIIDADAVLAGPVALKGFQPVSGGHTQIIQSPRDLQLPQLAACDSGDVGESLDRFTPRKSLCVCTPERPDHNPILTPDVINGKHDCCGASSLHSREFPFREVVNGAATGMPDFLNIR